MRRHIPIDFLFTLLSLVLMAFLIVLPNLQVQNARKRVHEEDMHILREAIHRYIIDNGGPPATLEDLVKDGYLKAISEDPLLPDLREMDPIALKDYLAGR